MERSPHGAVPIALPFDDEGDAPVPFTLTAAARRALDPADVPALRLVPTAPPGRVPAPAVASTSGPDDDLRPAQARALRRSGMRVVTIAAAMGVEVDLVAAWTADLAPRHESDGMPRPARAPGVATSGSGRGRPPVGRSPDAAAGLAVAIARIDSDGAALTLTDDRVEVLAVALDAVRRGTPLAAGTVRVAARTGPGLAVDRLRADLVRALDVPDERVVVGRWTGVADRDALEIRVRVADRRAVRLVDGWAVRVLSPVLEAAAQA